MAMCYFSRPASRKDYVYQPIYKIDKENIIGLIAPDVRLGGGGFIFVDILIICFIILLIYRYGKYRRWIYSALALIVASLFLLRYGYWYRYVPFVWFIPIFVIVYMDLNGYCGKMRRLLCVLLGINLMVTLAVVTGYNAYYKTKIEKKIIEAKNDKSSKKYAPWGFWYIYNGNRYLPKSDQEVIYSADGYF
jgi:hypothetical protein